MMISKKLFPYSFFVLLSAFTANTAHSFLNTWDGDIYEQVLEHSATPASDIKLYKKIFADIAKEKIASADKNIAKLKGSGLMGHVLAQKYLSRTYKTSYQELSGWLKKYPYLPEASQIRSLATIKAPGYKNKPVKSIARPIYAPYSWYREKYTKLTPDNRTYVRARVDEFLKAIRKGKNDDAAKVMDIHKFRMTIPDKNYDAMSATLAGAYFLDGYNDSALKWSKKAVERSHDGIAAWWGGLAAWRKKDYKLAAGYFEKLGALPGEDEWLTSAGAFWAYRSYLILKKPDMAAKNLRRATKFNKTFYGILAEYILTGEVKHDTDAKLYMTDLSDNKYIHDFTDSSHIRRAILLLMAGQEELAEEDLKANFKKLSNPQKELLLYLSEEHGLANLSYVVSSHLRTGERKYNNFMYPRPSWEPDGGWKINPAWIWALARQESLFSPRVVSHAGACGVMQVMPATAAMVTKDNSLKKNRKPLLNKRYNINVGQKYVQILRNDKEIGDNLFYLAASYNAGPHNVKKWFDRHDYGSDPLMFIEMIPWKETRLYVKRVVANYWIYSAAYGATSQTLKQVLDGNWPELEEVNLVADNGR